MVRPTGRSEKDEAGRRFQAERSTLPSLAFPTVHVSRKQFEEPTPSFFQVVLLSRSNAPDPVIDLKSIRGHCNVSEKYEEESSCSSEDEDGRPQYFCR